MISHHYRGDDPAELGYVSVMTLRDGKVVRFRDYLNPLQLSHR
jgi:ketosteroid isomerase-like protein